MEVHSCEARKQEHYWGRAAWESANQIQVKYSCQAYGWFPSAIPVAVTGVLSYKLDWHVSVKAKALTHKGQSSKGKNMLENKLFRKSSTNVRENSWLIVNNISNRYFCKYVPQGNPNLKKYKELVFGFFLIRHPHWECYNHHMQSCLLAEPFSEESP